MVKPSSILRSLSRTTPWLVRPFVSVWSRRYVERPEKEHWLCHELRLQLGVRRVVKLRTGGRLRIDPFGFLGRQLVEDGTYEPATVSVLVAALRPGMVFCDVGANIGHNSVIASRLVGKTGHVWSFEPNPAVFEELQSNIRLNRCRNVTCFNLALGSRAMRAPLYLSAHDVASSLARTAHTTSTTVEVAVETLDDLARQHGIGRVDLIKIDAEGAELPIIQGARHLIEQCTPALILELSDHFEAFSYSRDDFCRALAGMEYGLFAVSESRPLERYARSDTPAEFEDVLAVHRSRLELFRATGLVPN